MKKRMPCIIAELNYKQMNGKVIDKLICRYNHISFIIVLSNDNNNNNTIYIKITFNKVFMDECASCLNVN